MRNVRNQIMNFYTRGVLKLLEILIFAWIHGFFVGCCEHLGYIVVIPLMLILRAFLGLNVLPNLIRRASMNFMSKMSNVALNGNG